MSASTDTIECAGYGAEINALGYTSEKRMPCEKCGSTKRIRYASISDSAVARDGIGVKAEKLRIKNQIGKAKIVGF